MTQTMTTPNDTAQTLIEFYGLAQAKDIVARIIAGPTPDCDVAFWGDVRSLLALETASDQPAPLYPNTVDNGRGFRVDQEEA